jgi:hypothetical protein
MNLQHKIKVPDESYLKKNSALVTLLRQCRWLSDLIVFFNIENAYICRYRNNIQKGTILYQCIFVIYTHFCQIESSFDIQSLYRTFDVSLSNLMNRFVFYGNMSLIKL